MSEKKSVLSAIQPTGDLHLGNYFGAIKNWLHLQDKYNCKLGVVDYHTMTMPYNPKKMRENTWSMVFQLIACGIKPENIFIQSMIPEHTDLNWILNCVTSYGQVTRMTQFKDKSEQINDTKKDSFVSVGLFGYPVLQAADILIYHADFVPVGKDQIQHLELTRNIALRFNNQFNKDYFTLPEPLLTEVPKLLSLADPNRKMSKSLGEKHFVNMFGDLNRIKKQIRSAVTDSGNTPEGEMSAGVENLFTLIRACGNLEAHDSLMEDYNNDSLKYSELKEVVSSSVEGLILPVQEKMKEISADKKLLKSMIKDSSNEIRKVAQQTMKEVRELTGIMSIRY